MNDDLKMYLAEKGAVNGSVVTSTRLISKELSISQQTVSRLLIGFEEDGLIVRQVSSRGMQVRFTEKAVKNLHHRYELLKSIFSPKQIIKGKVMKGLGEGKYYMNIYSSRIKEKLGYKPYSGTLNLAVNPESVRMFLLAQKSLHIEAFTNNDRTFGGITLYPVLIKDVTCAILIPDRTTHLDKTIEVISGKNLRELLNIHDGSSITIERVKQ